MELVVAAARTWNLPPDYVATLQRSLARHGFNAGALHGDMDQRSRTQTLDDFRKDKLTLLVASDVAARGNFCTVDDQGVITDRRAGRPATERCVAMCQKLQQIRVPGVEVALLTPFQR